MKRNRRITQDHSHAQKLARSMNSQSLSMNTRDRSVMVIVVVMILTTRERKTLNPTDGFSISVAFELICRARGDGGRVEVVDGEGGGCS